eukprot:scaffold15718_cov126-Cylindrotheca_fusiformis.AAC.3
MGSDVLGCSMDGEVVVDRILCILTYGGSGVDMGINYFLLALNLLCCTTITMTLSSTELYRRKWALVAALASVVAFQVVLCLILGCSGISIIWCAMAGWMISQQRFEASKERSSETTSRNAPGDEQQRQGTNYNCRTFLCSYSRECPLVFDGPALCPFPKLCRPTAPDNNVSNTATGGGISVVLDTAIVALRVIVARC